MVALLLIGIALVLTLVAVARFAIRRHQTPPDLRGDWWQRFEADFRAYERQCAGKPPRRKRRPNAREERQPPA